MSFDEGIARDSRYRFLIAFEDGLAKRVEVVRSRSGF
jgi:hypothetical protein